ncbi:MAG: hypothetical protein J1G06_01405 [Oscillospiraceae bacterium]|nr:hypothetical protein [Oscillospiraceae bacterium]
MDNGYINMPEGDDYENSGSFQPSRRQMDEQPENEDQFYPQYLDTAISTETKKKPKTLLIIGIIATAVIVLGVSAFFIFRPGGAGSGTKPADFTADIAAAEETVTIFSKAYNDGDFDTLTECLDSDIRDKIDNIKSYGSIISAVAGVDIDIDSLLSQALGYAAFGASFDIREMTTTINGDTAKVDAEIVLKTSISGTKKGETTHQKFSLVKEDGKWYISGLK